MAQKTAVEWLEIRFYFTKGQLIDIDFQQALEMEKKQIENAFNQGFSTLKWDKSKENKAEQHYDENFKSNQNETETN